MANNFDNIETRRLRDVLGSLPVSTNQQVVATDLTATIVQPAIPGGYATAAQGALADTAVQPGDLATVATSGAYDDLSGKPVLGAAAFADFADQPTAEAGVNNDKAMTALGVRLKLEAGMPSANEVGAEDAEDPSARATFAPALVTSMQQRRLNGVSLRGLLGVAYSPSRDAASALNEFLAELCPDNVAVNDPHGLDVLLENSLIIRDNMAIDFSRGTTLRKGFSASGLPGAMIRNQSQLIRPTNVSIKNFNMAPASPSFTGTMVHIVADGAVIEGVKILDYFNGAAFKIAGDDVTVSGCEIYTSQLVSGTDGFRILGGNRIRVIGCKGVSGDDFLTFSPVENNTDNLFGLNAFDIFFIGCVGRSRIAKLMAVNLDAGHTTGTPIPSTVRNVGWIGCGGYGGDRGFLILNDGGALSDNQIDGVVMRDCTISGAMAGGTPQSEYGLVRTTQDAAIGRVLIDNLQMSDIPTDYGVRMRGGSELNVANSRVQGQRYALDVETGKKLVLRDTKLQVVNTIAGKAAEHVMRVQVPADVTYDNVDFSGIATSKRAVLVTAGGVGGVHRFTKPTFTKVVGATTTVAVDAPSGTPVFMTEPLGTIDSLKPTATDMRFDFARSSVGGLNTSRGASATVTANWIGVRNRATGTGGYVFTFDATLPIGTEIDIFCLATNPVTLVGSGATVVGKTSIANGEAARVVQVTSGSWVGK